MTSIQPAASARPERAAGRNPTVLFVQHGDEGPPTRLGRWLAEAGCDAELVLAHRGEELPPSLLGFDALVVLGGAMGANDDGEFPWLSPTKALLREASQRDLPTLGVCLGHQLLAVANGGRVVVAEVSQVGVTSVRPTAEAENDPLFGGLGAAPTAVHWNNDMVVEPPPGAVVLSHSAVGIQALRLGNHVYGVQFHPEVDPPTAGLWADGDVRKGVLTADDADATLAGIRAADPELDQTWRGFALRFAALVHAAAA